MTEKPDTPENEHEKKEDLYDVFDDVRESLAEDESQDEQSSERKKGFFKSLKGIRFPKRSKKKEIEEPDLSEEDEVPVPESSEKKDLDEADLFAEIDIPAADVSPDEEDADLEERLAEAKVFLNEEELLDELLEEAEDLIDEEDEVDEEPEEVVEAPRLSEALETDADNIRDIALEDYTEEELEEVDERKNAWKDYSRGRMGRLEWIVIVVVGLIIGSIFIWGGIQANGGLSLSEPEPTRTPDPNVPIPTSVQLPGGWAFRLGKGSLSAEGEWEPTRAEWLQGTEICKWIALPWSAQLEAVLQTLEAGDEIELSMNNLDVLKYRVYSRQKVDSIQAEELNLDTPSLLIILYGEESGQKLVLTAVLDYESLEE